MKSSWPASVPRAPLRRLASSSASAACAFAAPRRFASSTAAAPLQGSPSARPAASLRPVPKSRGRAPPTRARKAAALRPERFHDASTARASGSFRCVHRRPDDSPVRLFLTLLMHSSGVHPQGLVSSQGRRRTRRGYVLVAPCVTARTPSSTGGGLVESLAGRASLSLVVEVAGGCRMWRSACSCAGHCQLTTSPSSSASSVATSCWRSATKARTS